MDSSSDSVGDILSGDWASIQTGRPSTRDCLSIGARPPSREGAIPVVSLEHKPHTYLKGVKAIHGIGSENSFEKHAISYLM